MQIPTVIYTNGAARAMVTSAEIQQQLLHRAAATSLDMVTS
jgi:hypothetical protein